jgi:hypothetical protein
LHPILTARYRPAHVHMGTQSCPVGRISAKNTNGVRRW